MYLDTDPSLTRAWRIRTLADSPFALGELERILVEEIHPVCRYNLRSVAGEWSGFDPAWLEGRILGRCNSAFRWLRMFDLGRFAAPRFDEWRITRNGIAGLRSSMTPERPHLSSSER